ncbi:MAG: hypothetical protein ABIH72_05400 [archaeon]
MESNLKLEEADGVLVRHGEAKYEQGIVSSLGLAYDLTFNGSIKVMLEAYNFYKRLGEAKKPFKVFYSDYGRTAETARIWRDTARIEGKVPIGEMFSRKGLREVENFDLALTLALVNGGEYVLNGKKVMINKEKTNPFDLDIGDFWISGAYLRLPDDLPEAIIGKMRILESYEAVNTRFNREIQELRGLSKDSRVIVVTHLGLIDKLAKKAGISETLGSGDYLPFKWGERDLIV